MFTFLNPLFLIGLAAAAVPILIHLLSRRRLHTVYFSAMRFLHTSHRKGARRVRIRQLLLIILRALLFALIAMALARPYFGAIPTSAEGEAVLGDRQKSVVVILDNSFSMGYRESSKSKFELAKEEAGEIIRSLKGGDEISLILMSDKSEVMARGSVAAGLAVAQDLDRVSLSHRPSDVVPSLSSAYDILADSHNPEKNIFILTDLQANGWGEFALNRIENYDPRVRLFLIRLSGESEINAAVDEVQTKPSRIGEDRPVEIIAGVAEYGDLAPQTLGLFIDNGKRGEKHIEKPGKISFTLTLSPAGVHPAYVRKDDDFLALDDRYYFVLDVGRSTSVLVADGSRGKSSSERDGFFLNVALLPPNAGNDEEAPGLPIKTTLIDLEQLASANLADHRVVIIANLGQPSSEVGLKLSKFVADGGGLLLFLGDRVESTSYNEVLADILPANLTEKKTGDPIPLGETDRTHHIFSLFDETNSERTDFTGFYNTEAKSEARVLARLADGTALMIEKAFGRGTVIMVTSSADTSWNNMAVKTVYLPVIHRLVEYLSGQNVLGSKTITVGQTYTVKRGWEALGKAIVITNPLGEREKVIAKPAPGGALITYASTEWAGLYHIKTEDADDDYFAINLDAAESDLTPLEGNEVKEFFPEGNVIVASDLRSLMANLNVGTGSFELWKPFLSLVLLLMIAESIITQRWDGRNQKSKTQKVNDRND